MHKIELQLSKKRKNKKNFSDLINVYICDANGKGDKLVHRLRKRMFSRHLSVNQFHNINEFNLNFVSEELPSDLDQKMSSDSDYVTEYSDSEFDGSIENNSNVIEEMKNSVEEQIHLENYNTKLTTIYCLKTKQYVPKIKIYSEDEEELNKIIGNGYVFYNIIGKCFKTHLYILCKKSSNNILYIFKCKRVGRIKQYIRKSYLFEVNKYFDSKMYYIIPIKIGGNSVGKNDNDILSYINSRLPYSLVSGIEIMFSPDITDELLNVGRLTVGACDFIGFISIFHLIYGISNNINKLFKIIIADKNNILLTNFLKLIFYQQLGVFSIHGKSNYVYQVYLSNHVKSIGYDEYLEEQEIFLWKDKPCRKRGRPKLKENTKEYVESRNIYENDRKKRRLNMG